MSKTHIKNSTQLLQHIADGIKYVQNCNPRTTIANISVTFYNDDAEALSFALDIATAIDWIINDVYFDESNNWATATIAKVDVF